MSVHAAEMKWGLPPFQKNILEKYLLSKGAFLPVNLFKNFGIDIIHM